MADAGLDNTQSRQNFFQNAITRMASYWNESDAVKNIQVNILDKERETILKAITLALDVTPAWSITKNLIITFTPYMERRGHWEAWHELLYKAIENAREHQDLKGETTLTALLARLCQRQSRFKETVRLYRKVIKLAKQTGDKYEEARACSNLGYYFIDAGHWWRSEILNCHALRIFETLSNQHGLAHTHNHLGLLNKERHRWESARNHLGKAIQIWEETNDDYGLMFAYNNLGITILESSNPDEAIEYFQKAIDKATLTGSTSLQASYLMNLGNAYLVYGSIDDAQKVTSRAEHVSKLSGDSYILAKSRLILGEVFTKREDWVQAQLHLELAENGFKRLQLPILEAEVIAVFLDMFHSSGKHHHFDEYYEKFTALTKKHHLDFSPKITNVLEKYHRD